jgi:hypothetical protein
VRVIAGDISVEEKDDFSRAEAEGPHATRQGRSNFPTIRKKKKKIRLEPDSVPLSVHNVINHPSKKRLKGRYSIITWIFSFNVLVKTL